MSAAESDTLVVLRDGDYYGGDLVLRETDYRAAVALTWNAWGQYGGGEIRLSVKEAARLAEGLRLWVDSVPEDWRGW